MDFVQIMAFTFVALLLVVSPGPNGLLIAKTVPLSGKKAGFANVAGFLSAFYIHGSLSLLGISVLLTKSAEAFFIVKIIGAMYLIYLGLKSLKSAFINDKQLKETQVNTSKSTLKKAFFEGFLTNVLNPKVSMFYLAAFPQFIPAGENAILYGFILVSIHSAMNMAWFSSMVLLFSKLTGAAKNRIFQRILRAFTGIVFIGFGAKLITLDTK